MLPAGRMPSMIIPRNHQSAVSLLLLLLLLLAAATAAL
jgi:hypothetical protein